MRCPYCSSLNNDKATYCVHCGRDLTGTPSRQSTQTSQRPAYPPAPTQYQPAPSQNTQRPAPPQNAPRPAQPVVPQQVPAYRAPQVGQRPTNPTPVNPPVNPQTVVPVSAPPAATRPPRQRLSAMPAAYGTVETVEPAAPEAPAPFPPKSAAQLQALLTGALDYTLVTDTAGYGKKKIVRIAYRRCAAWQQTATLLKALKEYDSPKFETVVIQGVFENAPDTYAYTNGQLVFDRNTRLGSQVLNRYQIETGNGYASDSIRFVLTE